MDDIILRRLLGELYRLEYQLHSIPRIRPRVVEIQSMAREWRHPELSALCARVLARMEHHLLPGSTAALQLARRALRHVSGCAQWTSESTALKGGIHILMAGILRHRNPAAPDIETQLRAAIDAFMVYYNLNGAANALHQLVSHLADRGRLTEAFEQLDRLYQLIGHDRLVPEIVLTHVALLRKVTRTDQALAQLGRILRAHHRSPDNDGLLRFHAKLAHDISAQILAEQGDDATALRHLNQLAKLANVRPGTTNCPLDLVKRMANAHEKLGNHAALRVLLNHPIAVLQETGADDDSLFELLMAKFFHLPGAGGFDWLPLYELACRTNNPAHFQELESFTPPEYKCPHRRVHSWARKDYQYRGDALGAARTRVAEAKAILPSLRGRTSRRAARETARLLKLIGSVPLTASVHHDADLLLDCHRVRAALHQLGLTPQDGLAKCHLLAAILLADQIGDAAAALETRGDLVAFLQQRGLQHEAQPWIAEIQYLRDAADSEPSADTEPPMAA